MYKFDVEYLNLDDKFTAVVTCVECDKNSSKELFKHAIPNNDNGIVGQTEYVTLNNCITEPKYTIEEVEKEVEKIINDLKVGIEQKRNKIIKTEEYTI